MRGYNEVVFHTPKSVKDTHDRVVELIRQHPGISNGELAKLLELNPSQMRSLGSTLTQLCFKGRIKYQEVHRYTVIDAE